MAERQDLAAGANMNARTKNHVRTDRHILLKHGVVAQEGACWVGQGGAAGHSPCAQTSLDHCFRHRQVGTAIDAEQGLFCRFEHYGLAPVCSGDGNDVCQIVFALGIVIVESRQQSR